MQKLLVLVIMISFVSTSIASLPQVKSYNQQKDLIDGRAKGVSISWDGELLLAPAVRPVFDSNRPFCWDLAADSKDNLFFATGDGAKIYHTSPDGKSKIISQWENLEVYSLAFDNRGILYAGTSPDGKIYRIHQNKAPELFVELKVKYTWDIIFDRQNKCYVATGDSGAIYVIDERGKASIFYNSDETHIRCLAWDNNDQLLAGSYPNGYLYRINSSGQAFVVYDSEYQEIHEICVARDGTIYAAGLGQEQPKGIISKDRDKTTRSEASLEITDAIVISAKPAEISKISKSGIIKIQPNGMIKNIWQQNTDPVQSIALGENQSLLAGTGDKGRLYKIDSRDESTLLMNFEASQVVALKPGAAATIWVATSNLGKIFQLESKFEKKGSYESAVFDAQTSAHWGTIQWDEQLPPGCSVKLFCRSGNTGKQNSTWSSWAEIHKNEVIKSPAARFIQWKLELSANRATETPSVKNIKLSYLQQNLPPEILSITVHDVERKQELQPAPTPEPSSIRISLEETGAPGQQRPVPQPTVRRQLRNGYRRVSWKARDQNNDQLSYDLYFQEKVDKNWWVLKKKLTRTSHTWDSRLMPDGRYRIKVIADDKLSNPINTAKQAEKITDWFIIDNTVPEIEKIEVKKNENDSLQISFTALDELSPIQQVQISYDLQKWLWVYPQDLVCDSKREDFRFSIQADSNKYHSIIIKAQDQAENIKYARAKMKE